MTRPTLFIDSSIPSKAAALIASIVHSECVVENSNDSSKPLPRIVTDKGEITSLTFIVLHLTTDTPLAAASPAQQTEIDKYIELVSSISTSGVTENVLDYANEICLNQSYLVGFHVTAADFAIFSSLYETISQSQDKLSSRPSLMRWFAHIQTFQSNLPAIHFQFPTSKLFNFELPQTTPAKSTNSATTTANSAATAATTAAHNVSAAISTAASAIVSAVTTKKDEKSKDKTAKPAKESKPQPAEVAQIYRLDLRVAKILSVGHHPTEARLLVLSLDCGESSGPRTVVSGIADYVGDHQSLVGKYVLNMCNLAPGNIKGVDSNGRILVATDAVNEKVKEILYINESEAGEKISFSSIDAAKNPPDATIAPKNLHRVLKGLHTNDQGIAQFEQLNIETKSGPVRCNIKNGTVA